MLKKLFSFQNKNQNNSVKAQGKNHEKVIEKENSLPVKHKKLTIQEQREEQIKRKTLIINEFGKSLLNLQLETGILTPVYIVDVYDIDIDQPQKNYASFIENALTDCFEIHKQKLRQKIYRESFNLQPGELLIVVKEIEGEIVLCCKRFARNIDNLVELLSSGFFTANIHKLFFLRYFVPPVPDDLYKFDQISIPTQFEEVVKKIIRYCDRHFTTDNLPYEKWEKLITNLNISGMILKFPESEENAPLTNLLSEDYSDMGYHRLKAEEVVKDTIEKNPITLPLFIIFLGFFCSDKDDLQMYSYHYLFSPVRVNNKSSHTQPKNSFFKLFNLLLDEALLPNQFRKCMSTIYYEAFILHQYEVEDLFFKYREKYKQKLDSLGQNKPPLSFYQGEDT